MCGARIKKQPHKTLHNVRGKDKKLPHRVVSPGYAANLTNYRKFAL